MSGGRNRWILPVAGVIAALAVLYPPAAIVAPWLLAFPYQRTIDGTRVWSESPLTGDLSTVISRADSRVRTSPLYRPGEPSPSVYLTRGGLRWRILSLGAGRSFALTRPLGDNVVVNRSSVEQNSVWNGASDSGRRALSGVIAHERTHVLIRRRFGLASDRIYPRWLVEGYCDHVAGSSTLSDERAARMAAAHQTSPALFYHQARKRVEAELAANGGSVEVLFAVERAE